MDREIKEYKVINYEEVRDRIMKLPLATLIRPSLKDLLPRPGVYLSRVDVLNVLDESKQVDFYERKLVELPKFIGDILDIQQSAGLSLADAFALSYSNRPFKKWLDEDPQHVNDFAEAWLHDYLLKEPKYYVRIKATNQYLKESDDGFLFESISEGDKVPVFTKDKLLDNGFKWVFNHDGIEVIKWEV